MYLKLFASHTKVLKVIKTWNKKSNIEGTWVGIMQDNGYIV